MKIKIVYKLFAFFTILLFIFMLIINSFFYFFFNKQTIELHRNDLKEKVVTIANTIGLFLQDDIPANAPPPYLHSQQNHMGMMGSNSNMNMTVPPPIDPKLPYYRALGYYIKLLNKMDMCDIWIINNNHQFLISNNRHHKPVEYNDLPTGGIDVINKALQGETIVANSFSSVLGTPATTAAAPIKDAQGNYVGAVLMHAPISQLDTSVFYVIKLLGISSLLAMFLSLPASLLLSYYFTNPLRKMKQTALAIADGNYTNKTDIHHSDEIGDLAISLEQMGTRLAAAAEESGRIDKARRIFTANVSHELRTPVAVLRASLEALTNGVIKDPEKQKEYHQQMLKETIYLERLVNDMLELSKLQNPDFKTEKSKFILNDLINDAARAMRPFAAAKQIAIKNDIAIPPTEFTGDYGRLRQMIIIVLDNGIKFSPANGIIEMQLIADNNICLQIKDHGCGIDDSILGHIFDRFHKVNNERNKNGTGLGLAIAQQIATRHDIDIKVASKLDEGTTFSFIFPENTK